MDSHDKFLVDSLEDNILQTVSSAMEKVERPFGLLLSGGFDSGLLCALTKPDVVFRIKFPYGSLFDESVYSDAIIKHLGIASKVVDIEITEEQFRKSFEGAVRTMGEVCSHFSLVPFYLAMREISKDKHLKTLISGEGPDEYLGGYARYIVISLIRKMYEVPELRNYHNIITEMIGLREPKDISLLFLYAQFMKYDLDKVNEWLKKNTQELAKFSFLGILGRMDFDFGTIERMEQKMAVHFGLNLAYPYINPAFSDYCYVLPDIFKIREGVTKWGFRQVCRKYLPEMMMGRSKMGGPVAPVNRFMGWDLPPFDKTNYIKEQEKIWKNQKGV